MKLWKSESSGRNNIDKIAKVGKNVVIEDGVRIFHPDDTVLKGYYKGKLEIGNDVWIGQQCFIHAGGGIKIGNNVGIGPQVKMHAARHKPVDMKNDILLFSEIELCPIRIENNTNIGIGATIMGGVTIATGCRVGAGAVVTKNFKVYSILVGVPAHEIKN